MHNPAVQAYPVKQVTHSKMVVHPTWTPPARSEQVRHPRVVLCKRVWYAMLVNRSPNSS